MPAVRTGLDRLVADGARQLHGMRVGLVANQATVDASLRHVVDLLHAMPGVRLKALFGPEHGIFGHAQDLIGVADGDGPEPRLRVSSLYGSTFASLRPTPEQFAGLDILLVDLPDIGTRYYTFAATLYFCMETAAEIGLPILVLDRPNPLGGVQIEGPRLRPEFRSFVGWLDTPTRHGLTLGELARLYQREHCPKVDLHVLAVEGWRRRQQFHATGLPWVLPSPNMPTPDTALVYPGACLIEGTNCSEGRGTTRPFELCGAPWIDSHAIADRLARAELPGVVFRPARFQPTFQKHAGQLCGGVQIHVTDPERFLPVRTGLHLLAALRELGRGHFRWRTEVYEFVDHLPAIDLLFGSDRERLALEAGAAPEQIATAWEPEEADFAARRQPVLLYPVD